VTLLRHDSEGPVGEPAPVPPGRPVARQAKGSARVAHEHELSTMVRRAQGSPRVAAFVAGKGGVGTTSTAAGVALALGTLVPGQVALADTRTGTPSLGRLLGGAAAPDAGAYAAGAVEPAQVAGVAVVDGAPWDTPLGRPTLARVVADLRLDFAYTLLDVGADGSDIGHGALARSDRAVVVTTAAPDAMSAAENTLDRLYKIDRALAESAIVAVTGVGRLGRLGRRDRRDRRDRLGRWRPNERVVRVPWDDALAENGVVDIERLRRPTRAALLELAACLAEEVPS
jgi:MinD-like ATPase involved in chromosome partitioning or flagellar assembly